LPQGGSLKYVSSEMLLIKITEDENIFKSSSVIRPARTEVYQGYEADGIFRQPDLRQTKCWLLVPSHFGLMFGVFAGVVSTVVFVVSDKTGIT